MEWIQEALRFISHLDEHLGGMIRQYGAWIYGILFATVFCETGLVIMPFLPGDSLLFATGVLAGNPEHGLNVWILFAVYVAAALCGDNVNYWLGRTFGKRIAAKQNSRLIKPHHVEKTQHFMLKYGRKAIIIARFVPIVRTFMPFVAGMGAMEYRSFIGWSFIAALVWVIVCLLGGYFLGSIPAVKDNFEIAIFIIIGFTLLPIVLEFVRHKRGAKDDGLSEIGGA
jgi:membrane-associated protein